MENKKIPAPAHQVKTIFIGTPLFSLPSLGSLNKNEYFDICLIVTQEDKKSSRGLRSTPPPVKKYATEHNIPIEQPQKINELTEKIRALKPDIIIVIAYAQIIPKEILNIPKYGCVNIHGSLLPKYRGSACIQAAILNGERETGITFMQMDENMDTGDIITQHKIEINNNDTADMIYDKLSKISGNTIAKTLLDYTNGKIKLQKQDNDQASYTKKLTKRDGKINWQKNAQENQRFIRAMTSWPSAFGIINNKIIKIISASDQMLKNNSHEPGQIFVQKNKLAIQCGHDALIIEKIQLEGKKIMNGKEFINGYQNLINKIIT